MQNRRWLVLGITGTGKSYFAVYLVNKYVAMKQRKHVVIVDSTEAYCEALPWLAHCNVTPTDFSAIDFQSIIEANRYVLFEVSGLLPDQDVLFMDALTSAVMALGDTFLVVDEAHRYLPIYNPSTEFLILLREGRKFYIDTCLITQFPIDLNLIARRQANSLVIFKLLDNTDTDKVSFYLETTRQEILSLEQYEFFLKDRNTGDMIRGKL